MRPYQNLCIALLFFLTGCGDINMSGSVNPQTGKGGSMARFAITGNTLYIVDDQSLNFFELSQEGRPSKIGSKKLNFGIETIYPYKDKLFLGANDGMYIFDNSNPKDPLMISRFSHVQSCDPVVVQGDYAYVTLRNGTTCRFGNLQSTLDVIDISDPANPRMVHQQPMRTPYGLGVSGSHLFVCDGSNGLKSFDISDPKQPVQNGSLPEVTSYDVIVRSENTLIVTGAKGLYQFEFGGNPVKMEQLSLIPVVQ